MAVALRTKVAGFFAIVVIPSLLFFLYLTLVVSPEYSSEFRVLVRSAGQQKDMSLPQIPGLSLSSSANENSYAVIQYLESQAAALALNKMVSIKDLYADGQIDYTSRLNLKSSNYDLTRYWNRMLDAYFENTTGTIVVKVFAFKPADAQQIAQATLRLSETLVNDMSKRSRRDLLRYAEKDLADAQSDLRRIDANIFRLRNERGILDPRQSSTAVLERQAKLQSEITEVQAAYDSRSSYLSPGAPTMQVLRQQLSALRAGLNAVKLEMVAPNNGRSQSLSSAINAFERLQADENFAQKRYQAALANFQSARTQDIQQHLYLETIVPPTLSDQYAYPSIFKYLAVFALLATAVWAVVTIFLENAFERV
ncbi:hypothetical protein [Sphingomonas sp. PAMC 26617]|uniref:hypothetical protein n=1 Tax=Sphingomonas sp. PAMC 26617 TaxID=1112216 RepID=UPI000497624E|nr:hypothetical protein [Sphingomonas sp. PAMC 26617]